MCWPCYRRDDEFGGGYKNPPGYGGGGPQLIGTPGEGCARNPWYNEEDPISDYVSHEPLTSTWFTDREIEEHHTYYQQVCSACGYKGHTSTTVQAGDEYIDICPECYSLESFECKKFNDLDFDLERDEYDRRDSGL